MQSKVLIVRVDPINRGWGAVVPRDDATIIGTTATPCNTNCIGYKKIGGLKLRIGTTRGGLWKRKFACEQRADEKAGSSFSNAW